MTSRFLGYLALAVATLLIVAVVLLVRHRRRILRGTADVALSAAAHAVRTKRRIASAIERRIEEVDTSPPQSMPDATTPQETAEQRRQRRYGS